MSKKPVSIFLSFLMVMLSLSIVSNSLNKEIELSNLDDSTEPQHVILPMVQLNEPGFQEGSIFTDTTLSSGSAHTCVVLDHEGVSCWGRGDYGQLGNGATLNSFAPGLTLDFGTARTAVSVVSGSHHNCALLDNGSVSCWGLNTYGQLGNGGTSDTSTPTLTNSLGTGRTAIALSSGHEHTCAILDNGSVSCWGRGLWGQLGNGATSDTSTPTLTSSLGENRTALAIAAGAQHTCAILDNGVVSCWGNHYYGQMGNGATANQLTPMQTNSLGTSRTAVAISAGLHFNCVILDNGDVSCWGQGENNGQLGNGVASNRNTPVPTNSLGSGRTAVGLSLGYYHACAVLDDGSASCWGRGVLGQLGHGSASSEFSPIGTDSFGSGRTAVAVSSGGSHTCAILDNGYVSCWGDNPKGQLGNGGTSQQNSPTSTSSLGPSTTLGVTEIVSGYQHTCALMETGSVYCWGRGGYGQIGDGAFSDSYTPTSVSSFGTGRTAVSISSSNHHTCAVLDNGAISCWGRNNYAQLGNGGTSDTSTPTLTSSLGAGRTAVAVSAGSEHTCAILDNGAVSCWGRNAYGTLGNGGNTDASEPTLTDSLGAGRTAVSVSLGSQHTCALLDNGAVSCWGNHYYGQMGNGASSNQRSPALTDSFGAGRTVIDLSVGLNFNCAVLDNGDVSCWGQGENNGQLGNGAASNKNTPTLTNSLGTGRTAVSISSGNFHACAVLDDESVSCWGRNTYGQLGNGGTTNQYSPALTSSLGNGRTAVDLSAGGSHTCAILDNGAVSCWGENVRGQLGYGGTAQKNSPTPTSSIGLSPTAALSERDFDNNGILNIFELEAGPGQGFVVDEIRSGYQHTCALIDTGSVYCWGRGDYGQVGNGAFSDRYTPTSVSSFGSGRTAVSISSSNHHTCAILDNGAISCWGRNNYGQLGNGGTSDTSTPTLTSSLGAGRTAVAVSAGSEHTCAILDNGAVSCWGRNAYGTLGNGGNTDASTPTLTDSLGAGRTAVSVSLGTQHTCALLDNGAVSCWGNHYYGQMGNGATSNQRSPALTDSFGAGRTVTDLSVGLNFNCAVLDNGDVSCWGQGEYNGQLGNGAPSNRNTPTLTDSLGTGRTAVNISSGNFHACAVLDDGSVSCWGRNAYGQLGNGGTTNQYSPAPTNSLGNGRTAVDLSAGGSHTCAILDNSDVSCWGENPRGQLGYGGTSQKNSPTLTASFGPTVNLVNTIPRVDCDVGQYGLFMCVDAPLGKYVPSNGSMYATDSSEGYFVNQTGQSSQTPCATGTYQPLIGQYSCDVADAGYFVPSLAQTTQSPCLIGTYQALTGQSSCDDADAGHYVDLSAQSQQNPCELGTYQALTGQSSCVDADAGHYVPSMGQAAQSPCTVGTYQPLTGQSSCNDADAGHYVGSTGQAVQSPCAVGTYQPLTKQASCEDTDPGYYANSTAQTQQTPCLGGTYQSSSRQVTCVDADPGYFVESIAQIEQTACSVGTYQPLAGQLACDDADAGHYVDETGQSSQTPCESGTYNPQTGSTNQSACLLADAGHYVAQTGQISQSECLAGTYQPNVSQSSCRAADIGFYVPQDAAVNQTECPAKTSTKTAGSALATDCILDTDSDLLPDEIDTDDDNDGTLDVDDAFPLDPTEDTDTDGDGRGDNMQSEAEAKQRRMVTTVVLILVFTALVAAGLVLRSRRADEDDDDWDKDDFDFGDEYMNSGPKSPPPIVQSSVESDSNFVATWEELPSGDWLENDEDGTNWYLADDGNRWYSVEDGFQVWEDES